MSSVALSRNGQGRRPRFGAHMSMAGGYHRAVHTAHARGFETVALFTTARCRNNLSSLTRPIRVWATHLLLTTGESGVG
jgi:endonuclease IV